MSLGDHITHVESVVCSTILGIAGALGSEIDNMMVSTLFYVHYEILSRIKLYHRYECKETCIR